MRTFGLDRRVGRSIRRANRRFHPVMRGGVALAELRVHTNDVHTNEEPAEFAPKRATDRGSPSRGASVAVHQALAQAADVVSGSGAAVLLVHVGALTYLPSPVAAVAAVERRAVDRADGAWAGAATSRRPVSTTDSADDLPAVAAAPMFDGRRMIGVLGVYDVLERAWSDRDLHYVRLLANFVGRHVASDAELQQQRDLVAQLTAALDSRVVIEQAKGILAAQQRIAPDAAFRILRKRSRDRNTKLRQIAVEIVAEVARLPDVTQSA